MKVATSKDFKNKYGFNHHETEPNLIKIRKTPCLPLYQ